MKSANSSASWGSARGSSVDFGVGVCEERCCCCFLWERVEGRLDGGFGGVDVVVRRLRSSAEKQSRRRVEFVVIVGSSGGMVLGRI